MPYIDVDGERLFYALHAGAALNAGKLRSARSARSECSLVLIHGAGGSHLVWPAELRRLSGVTVYALDLPAHGKSGGQGRSCVGEYARVVGGFLDAVQVDRAVLAGHSMGGAIVQHMALNVPARLAGLILVATGARLRVAPVILDGVLADYAAALDTINRYAWGPEAPEQLVRLGRRQLAQSDAQVTHGDYVACNTFDVLERLGQIALPTLVIGGTADQLTPAKYAATLAERIPGAQVCLIENAGHMVMLERPVQVARAVSDFLQDLSLS